jgi:hypothetical protein
MYGEKELADEALRRVLGSLYPNGDHLLSSFLYGEPGAPHWQRRLGAEVFAQQDRYIDALLFIRKRGAPFLRDIAVGELRGMVTHFVTEHYAWITGGHVFLHPGVSLAQQMPTQGWEALSSAWLRSQLFKPVNEVTLYPLTIVRVADCFQSSHFALCTAGDLPASLDVFGVRPPSLLPAQLPPFDGTRAQSMPVSDWLCVSAPVPLIARKRVRAILGALALAVIRRERYLQTGRDVQAGYCAISREKFTYGDDVQPVTPRMPSNINITKADHAWLDGLVALFDSSGLHEKSQLRALEYFYRAWFDDPRERFPTLCMALDSLVVTQHEFTKAAVRFVRSTVDEPLDENRLRLLLRLRGAVVHGAAPDVYESEHYDAYYATYGEDPICDLELVVARCLRRSIFGDRFTVQPDPHAAIVKKQQELGRLPRVLRGKSILGDD